jgi:hypothetical protein
MAETRRTFVALELRCLQDLRHGYFSHAVNIGKDGLGEWKDCASRLRG